MYATGHEDCVGFPDNLKPRAEGRTRGCLWFLEWKSLGRGDGGETESRRIYMGNLMCIFANPE